MYVVYILYSHKIDQYYIGFTKDITDRLRRHNTKNKGFTNKAKDWKIVYREYFHDKLDALKREKEIKSWKSRTLIEKLISSAGLEHSN
ncbi:GIY-YIG nuclease family protein [Sphingobacterium daejeonense]|uniref:GIY-YIG nuclease family protein n=1 Tax=Sphingobacterium daejeonense TaxID=371142 RepID=UPI0021A60BAC|nr:GIY-YIG nuclease family protein [Sphingobacterium daejeonense]MCT1531917.1 GIY-YIG nuclease family protein [Sphingobacterium daejeonense]